MIAKGWVTLKGDGLWADKKVKGRRVFLKLTPVSIIDDGDDPYGSLLADFSKSRWDIYKLGLMYTDSGVERGVQQILKRAGFKHWRDLCWSEQGRQSELYADFDMGRELTKELMEKELISEGEIYHLE